jgi:hypothetical protein
MDFVFVFLDAGTKNLYQLRQWIQPLQRMSANFKIGVLYTSNFAHEELFGSGLHSFKVDGQEGIHEFLTTNKPKVLLYPNQNAKNFFALRYRSGIHVWVSHGESDKAYMYQNTLKRYDLYFAAGQAAADRVARNVQGYSPERMLFIGRPQINDVLAAPSDYQRAPKGVRSVLYAPTWEGVTRATRYSSIDTHGVELVRKLIALGNQVIYRPHPLSGTRDASVAKADAEIRSIIKNANADKGRSFKHYVDGSTFGWQLSNLDVMITDVSAVAYDWLVTGKPLMITKPEDRRALVEDVAIFKTLLPLKTDELATLEAKLADALELAEDSNGPLKKLREYYYGSTEDYDTLFEVALKRSLALHTQQLAENPLVEPGLFASRGSKLTLGYRYVNFAIRASAGLLGLWRPARLAAPDATQVEELFTHFSDPFNGRSVIPITRELWKLSKARDQKMVLATNQVSTGFYVKSYFAIRSVLSLKWQKIRILPTITAGDSEVVLRRLTPNRVNYLKHHPINLMMLRSNGTTHVLFSPETDPLFEPGHSLIMYDRVATESQMVIEVVETCPDISRPIVESRKSSV